MVAPEVLEAEDAVEEVVKVVAAHWISSSCNDFMVVMIKQTMRVRRR